MNATGHAGPPRPRHDDSGLPTTTHAAWGAGEPRLMISSEGIHHTYALTADHVRIGSARECELQLDGIDRVHAEIVHDSADEYVLVLHGAADASESQTPVPTIDAAGEVLRTGAQFVLGPWRFVFMRAEFADHGRPYGGRQGGEGAHQRPQPPRPDYTRLHPTSEDNARAHATGETRTEE